MATSGSPSVLHRRFRKEILNLPVEYNILNYKYYTLHPQISDFLLNYNYEHDFKSEKQLDDLKFPVTFHLKGSNLFLNMIITNMGKYPFTQPKILLKNKSILLYYKSNLYIKYKKKFQEAKKCCMICSSVLSSSNWSVLAHFTEIFYEILLNLTNIKRATEMFHMEKISNKYLKGDPYLNGYALGFL